MINFIIPFSVSMEDVITFFSNYLEKENQPQILDRVLDIEGKEFIYLDWIYPKERMDHLNLFYEVKTEEDLIDMEDNLEVFSFISQSFYVPYLLRLNTKNNNQVFATKYDILITLIKDLDDNLQKIEFNECFNLEDFENKKIYFDKKDNELVILKDL